MQSKGLDSIPSYCHCVLPLVPSERPTTHAPSPRISRLYPSPTDQIFARPANRIEQYQSRFETTERGEAGEAQSLLKSQFTGRRERSSGPAQEQRPVIRPEDRVGAEEGDQGEYRTSTDDWELCWKTARYASAGQRAEHPVQREDSEEAQSTGAEVLTGGRVTWVLQYAALKDTGRRIAYFSLSSQKSKCLTLLSLIDHFIWNQSDIRGGTQCPREIRRTYSYKLHSPSIITLIVCDWHLLL